MKKINLIQAIFKTVNILKSVCPEYDDENDYFKEFWIIYNKNEKILSDLTSLEKNTKILKENLNKKKVLSF